MKPYTIKREVTIRSRFGNYRTVVKEFVDNVHWIRWYDKVHESGAKVTGFRNLK